MPWGRHYQVFGCPNFSNFPWNPCRGLPVQPSLFLRLCVGVCTRVNRMFWTPAVGNRCARAVHLSPATLFLVARSGLVSPQDYSWLSESPLVGRNCVPSCHEIGYLFMRAVRTALWVSDIYETSDGNKACFYCNKMRARMQTSHRDNGLVTYTNRQSELLCIFHSILILIGYWHTDNSW